MTTRSSACLATTRLAVLLTLASACGGPAPEGDEELGILPQALTRGPWTFEGKPLDAYTQAEAQADFGASTGWVATNQITVGSSEGNEYLRVKLAASTENDGGKFYPLLWTSGEYATATLRWKMYLEPGWDFYNGDLKMAGVTGGKGYTGGAGDEAQANCDGWSSRFVLGGNPNNKLYAYYYGCDMTGTPSGGILYGNKLGTGCAVTVGEWYTLIISVQANTSGQANGKLRMWARRESDGTVCTVASSDTRRFANDTATYTWHENYPRKWNAEWFRGGAGTPPAEDHYLRVDDVLWNNYFYSTAPSL
ncbi:polysaccharide lyase [Pyxidicoccus trucidator]|uniref:polysaccharide lyase n=1 Tax=Pyxidicoccus trucidator TaxID=2709662 RepID=UPI0013DB9E7D|nr:hypothetical protein [Pyxidicoccus trucidator]